MLDLTSYFTTVSNLKIRFVKIYRIKLKIFIWIVQSFCCISGFPCITCRKVYKMKQSLMKHLKFECQKEPMFRCPYCDHRSKLKYNLKKHVVTVHKITVSSMNDIYKWNISENRQEQNKVVFVNKYFLIFWNTSTFWIIWRQVFQKDFHSPFGKTKNISTKYQFFLFELSPEITSLIRIFFHFCHKL